MSLKKLERLPPPPLSEEEKNDPDRALEVLETKILARIRALLRLPQTKMCPLAIGGFRRFSDDRSSLIGTSGDESILLRNPTFLMQMAAMEIYALKHRPRVALFDLLHLRLQYLQQRQGVRHSCGAGPDLELLDRMEPWDAV